MKRIAYLALALVCLLAFAVPTMAEDGNVTYSGNAGEFIFQPGSEYSVTDLFPEFKGVMPGDTYEQKILLKNNADRKVKVDLFLRALGAHEESEAFLSQLKLTVQKADGAVIFDAPADETGQLTDWVYLGSLYSGGMGEVTVILEVPDSIGSEFAGAIGYLDWEFMVNEVPDAPYDPFWHIHPTIWPLVVLIVSGVCMAAVLLWGRRKKK